MNHGLRGPLPGVPAHVMPVFFSFAQVREDLAKYVAPLSSQQLWRSVDGASIGFHMQHLAGSVDRLTTYLLGRQLSDEQLQQLRSEGTGNQDAAELLKAVHSALCEAEERLRTVSAASLFEARVVGRKKLPTSVFGLLVHVAEHTQRHLGQAITLCKHVRQAA